ncbi:porin family protein [Vibrio maerlii]|uniref:porin family protein n=1 Tax=Vibrio maerlii TaxID=2231648 RepID=UPI000E3D9628|nr:porin family protein [Vibrio maerlii]
MYNKIIKSMSLLGLLFTANSQANYSEQYSYFGLGFTAANADVDIAPLGSFSFDSSLLGLVLGHRFHPNFAAEVRGYGSISDDELLGVTTEIDNSFSVIAKGIIPLGQYFDFYGSLGYGRSKLSLSANGVSISDTDDDFQYGIGLAVNKGAELELQIEWMKLYDDNDLEIDGFNLNLIYRL